MRRFHEPYRTGSDARAALGTCGSGGAVPCATLDRIHVPGCRRIAEGTWSEEAGRRAGTQSGVPPQFECKNQDGVIALPSPLTETAIREGLRERLRAGSAKRLTIEEFWVPRSNERADLVTVGEWLDGYEIKSGRDNLRRLPRQVAAYGRVFDHCWAVVAEKHCAAVTTQLPAWWGIKVVCDAEPLRLIDLRPARLNPDVDSETLVRLLWREEVFEALQSFGMAPGPGSPRHQLWGELLAKTTVAQLQEVVRQSLARRDPARARIPTRRFSLSPAAA